MRGKIKITPQIADKIRLLDAAGLKYSEINVVLERDFDVTFSKGHLSDIVNGYRASDLGDFKEEDAEYILSLQENMEDTEKDIPRLEKLGIAYMIQRSTLEETIKHFKTVGIILTEEKLNQVCDEVEGWIKNDELQGDNEEWFGKLIAEKLAD